MGDTKVRYAGFWIRLVADLIDSVLLNVVSWLAGLMLIGAYYWVHFLSSGKPAAIPSWSSTVDSFSAQVVMAVLYIIAAAAYFIIGHQRYGTTLGKLPFRVFVVSARERGPLSWSQSTLRCAGYIVSYLPFGTGYLMAAFHPEKRALHDIIAGTVSVIVPKKVVSE